MTYLPASDIPHTSQDAGPRATFSISQQDISAWTALRAFACVWVVLFHFNGRFASPIGGIFIEKGYLAVDLFFVLSGAVIFHVYGNALSEGKFVWRSFLWKRFARIYPVHFVTVLAAVAILYGGAALGLGQAPGYDLGAALLANLFALQSLGVMDTLTLNYPAWSISAEIGAYILFPVLAYPCLVWPRRVLLGGCVLVFLALVIVVEQAPEHLFPSNTGGQKLTSLTYNYSILRILPEFLLGIIVCRCLAGQEGLSASASMAWLFAIGTLMPLALIAGQDWAFVLLGAALVGLLMVGQFQPPRWMTFLGTISYSIYMVHALVGITLFKAIEVLGGYPDNQVPLLWWPVVLAATVAAGYFMWRWVEEPMRRILTGIDQPTGQKSTQVGRTIAQMR